jgi:hypothetical protein
MVNSYFRGSPMTVEEELANKIRNTVSELNALLEEAGELDLRVDAQILARYPVISKKSYPNSVPLLEISLSRVLL